MFNFKEKLASLKAKLDKMFVDGWTQAWKWASVRLAIISTFLGTMVLTYPDESRKLIEYVPEIYRPILTFAFGSMVIYFRLKAAKDKTNG